MKKIIILSILFFCFLGLKAQYIKPRGLNSIYFEGIYTQNYKNRLLSYEHVMFGFKYWEINGRIGIGRVASVGDTNMVIPADLHFLYTYRKVIVDASIGILTTKTEFLSPRFCTGVALRFQPKRKGIFFIAGFNISTHPDYRFMPGVGIGKNF